MMPGPVVVIQGDPDSDPNPFCQARAADADGAKKGKSGSQSWIPLVCAKKGLQKLASGAAGLVSDHGHRGRLAGTGAHCSEARHIGPYPARPFYLR